MTAENFSPTSRYHSTDAAILKTAEGREIAYLRRRFLPLITGPVLAEHTVTEGDRLDNVTAQYLGDPEQFWRLCDANLAMKPDDLTREIGRRLKVPMP
jgi:hypothetical protein